MAIKRAVSLHLNGTQLGLKIHLISMKITSDA